MRILSWAKSHFLKGSRTAYNSGNFSSSLRRSRLTFFLFRDRESLDIKARSELRLGKFSSSAKSFKKAERLGYKLLDHHTNQFKAELGASNPIDAFRIVQKIDSKQERKIRSQEIASFLNKLNDTERVSLIQEMNTISPLPSEIADLLPWAPSRVEYEVDENDSFTKLNSEVLEIDRYRRELNRLQSSGSFQILKHISESIRNPLKIILLPISIPVLVVELLRRRTGGLSNQLDLQLPFHSSRNRNSIVFFPTNGVGFGHFTRMLSVAKKLKKERPETEIVFFTTMPTLHILSDEGFVCYHLPGRYRYDDMDPSAWNSICEEMLSLVFALHRPRAFIFDGAYPYRGMLNAINSHSDRMLKVWLRRGAIKEGSKGIPVDSIGSFHAIIRPGDSVSERFSDEFMHNVPILRTNPILLLEKSEMEERGSLRKRLGIPEEALLCYVQLGAGRINDIESDLSMTLEALSTFENVYPVIGESMLGERNTFENPRVRVIRDYPNSRYFSDVDFAIIAGGYNTYHEVIEACIPSICYPNSKTGRDDQFARTRLAVESGCMIAIRKRTKESIFISVNRIMDSEVRSSMREICSTLRRKNGAKDVSDWIIKHLSL